jgi:hypothetical protein
LLVAAPEEIEEKGNAPVTFLLNFGDELRRKAPLGNEPIENPSWIVRITLGSKGIQRRIPGYDRRTGFSFLSFTSRR